MNTTTLDIIIGMMVVTYIPRMLPALLFDRYRLPDWFGKWLRNIPYAALGALIFPGIIREETPLIGIIGGLTAGVLSLLDLHLVLVMAITIFVAFIAVYLP